MERELCHTEIDTVVIWNGEAFESYPAEKFHVTITHEGEIVLHVIQAEVPK